jgi:hypothetical protein
MSPFLRYFDFHFESLETSGPSPLQTFLLPWKPDAKYTISFFKMISVATAGGQVINYSSRFSLTGMTGTFPPAYEAAAKAIKGTDGPPTVNEVADAANPVSADAAAYNVAYTLQTGLTRYAPMQPVPPTKITKKNATPQYPTSAYTIAKTFLPIPKAVTTQTMVQTFSVKSVENTVGGALPLMHNTWMSGVHGLIPIAGTRRSQAVR